MESNGAISSDGFESDAINALFADLIDREPEKPASLIAFEESQRKSKGASLCHPHSLKI